MDDPELEAIRQKRLTELANTSSGNIPSSVLQQLRAQSGGGGSKSSDNNNEEQQQEIKRNLLAQILSTDARDRLSRISMVRPQRAVAIENLLIGMAQSGQLRGRVTEDQLIGVLDQVEQQESVTANPSGTASAAQSSGQGGKSIGGKITYARKDAFDDDDDW